MSDKFENVVVTAVKNQQQGHALLEKLVAVAQPGAVYGAPVTAGEYTIITASEVSVNVGFGYGMGGGSGSAQPASGETTGEEKPQGKAGEDTGFGGGMGGGGGGFSAGRPVAIIVIGPSGLRVEPVVDPTKIALAFFTALGAMFFMFRRMSRRPR
jgi:uncharacterized spore protein YtfJ